ncbi:MAG: TrkH family potassium uptake protein [Candidatus Nanosalina sp.]
MRNRRISGILGRFLQLYALLAYTPIVVAILYTEPFSNTFSFILTGTTSLLLGSLLAYLGDPGGPSVKEAIIATVGGWFLAVIIGAIPIAAFTSPVNAVFEAMAGLTTTGISMFLEPSRLPHSVLFWRSFMQWIGGLGILTFFIAVIRESGGISQRLFSAEAHKTDSGSIRPSLTKSIVDLWRVYGFITSAMIFIYVALGMNFFNAILHSFSGLSTGGFSTSAASIGAFSSAIQAVTVPFMFIGGVNFVLLYMLLKADWRHMLENTEFKLYTLVFVGVSALAAFELSSSVSTRQALLDGSFQAASLISSTGYSTMGIMEFSAPLLIIFLSVMFVGGSLGSTAGGLKVFRVAALFKLLKTRLRAYSLPESAVNRVSIDGEILEEESVKTISVLLFAWLSVTFASALLIVVFDGVSFMGAISSSISAAGNMGPLYLSGEALVNLSVSSKLVLIFGMLAGRLEMLPLLAIFNREVIKH